MDFSCIHNESDTTNMLRRTLDDLRASLDSNVEAHVCIAH
jgi:hypothetical protein